MADICIRQIDVGRLAHSRKRRETMQQPAVEQCLKLIHGKFARVKTADSNQNRTPGLIECPGYSFYTPDSFIHSGSCMNGFASTCAESECQATASGRAR